MSSASPVPVSSCTTPCTSSQTSPVMTLATGMDPKTRFRFDSAADRDLLTAASRRLHYPLFKPSCEAWEAIAKEVMAQRPGKRVTGRASYDRVKLLLEQRAGGKSNKVAAKAVAAEAEAKYADDMQMLDKIQEKWIVKANGKDRKTMLQEHAVAIGSDEVFRAMMGQAAASFSNAEVPPLDRSMVSTPRGDVTMSQQTTPTGRADVVVVGQVAASTPRAGVMTSQQTTSAGRSEVLAIGVSAAPTPRADVLPLEHCSHKRKAGSDASVACDADDMDRHLGSAAEPLSKRSRLDMMGVIERLMAQRDRELDIRERELAIAESRRRDDAEERRLLLAMVRKHSGL